MLSQYILTLLNFTEQAKKSYLTKALYCKDTAGHMDEVDNTADSNEGLVKWAAFTNNGAEVGLVGVTPCDVFNIDKLLLDGLEIKVKVDLNSYAFVLMGVETPNNVQTQGVLNHTETNLFHGVIPQCIIFGMVRNDTYNGNLGRDPFKFELIGLQDICLTVNREETPYSALDLTGGKKVDGYNTFFWGRGEMNCGHGIDIDGEDCESGYE